MTTEQNGVNPGVMIVGRASIQDGHIKADKGAHVCCMIQTQGYRLIIHKSNSAVCCHFQSTINEGQ